MRDIHGCVSGRREKLRYKQLHHLAGSPVPTRPPHAVLGYSIVVGYPELADQQNS